MEQKKDQEWISTLRGLAILLVFCSHLSSSGGATFKFIIGRIGVVIFFLFSGYLAMESRSKRTRKQYIFNRLLRMYPVYWVLLILTFCVNRIFQTGDLIDFNTLLANLTLFHQFIGFKEILGASWMMPIQVCFFMLIGMMGIVIFTKSYWVGKFRIDMKTVTITVLMVCAIIVGWVRYTTRIPFPTAFFLLMAVAFLGMNFNIEYGNGGGRRLGINLSSDLQYLNWVY